MLDAVLPELGFFFIVSLMIGFVVRKIDFSDYVEEFLMRIIFGICLFPLIAIPLGFINQLYYIPVFAAALVLMLISGEAVRFKKQAILKDKLILLVVGMAIVSFYVFNLGSDSHVWLEDGDPNGHAVVASYIAKTHTWMKPVDLFIARYIEPYPMGYQIWMGVLSSIGGNVSEVLKVFNNVMIAITFVAFFYFVQRLFKSYNIAACATFVLAAIPSFSTRFIFAQSLSMLQMIVGFYFIIRILQGDKHLIVWGGLILASLCLTHQTTAVVMGALMAAWLGFDTYHNKKLNRGFVACLLIGVIVAAPWWIYEYQKYGVDKIIFQLNLEKLAEKGPGLTDPNLRMYTINDLIVSTDIMDNMTGFGAFIFIMLVIVVVSIVAYRDSPYEVWLGFIWLAFTMLALFSNWLPVSFIPSRMWPYVSIPVAILVGNALFSTYKMEYAAFKGLTYMFVIGIVVMSFVPKAKMNSSTWPSSRFLSQDEYAMAGFLSSLPIGTKVMDACYYERVWGLNLWDDPTDREAIVFKSNGVNTSKYGWDSEGWLKLGSYSNSSVFTGTIDNMYGFLKQKNYSYIIIGDRCKQIGVDGDVFNKRIVDLRSSDRFGVAFEKGNERVYQLK